MVERTICLGGHHIELLEPGHGGTLILDLEYTLPHCPKHKIRANTAVTTSKRYAKTVTPYCPKCAADPLGEL